MAMITTREEIIKKLGMESLSYDAQQKVLENVATAVSTRMWRRIAETLDEHDLDKLESLMNEGKDDEVEKLIKSKVNDYQKFAIDTENEVIGAIATDKAAMTKSLHKLQQIDTATDAE